MVDMDGFIEFVNALGGITVNINRPIPVGGQTTGNIPPDRWLPPGEPGVMNPTIQAAVAAERGVPRAQIGARVDAALPEGAEAMPGVIVPRKTVAELRKLLDSDEAAEQISRTRSIRSSATTTAPTGSRRRRPARSSTCACSASPLSAVTRSATS